MPGGATFEFVVVPQLRQSPKERQLQQALARSHAAKVSHSSKKRPKDGPRKRVQFRAATSPPQHGNLQEGNSNQSLILPPHPKTIIGHSRLDPFDSEGTRQQLPEIGRRSLEYVYTVLWPKNYPAVGGQALTSMQHTWRRRAVEDLLQFHAQVFNAVTMCYALSMDPTTMKILMDIRLKHQTMAVKLVRKRLQALEGPAPEQLIADIMRLAVQGGDTFRLTSTSQYPETPLANAFALKPYGRFETSLPHFSALVQLVKQRGGLKTLSVSVSHPIQLIDIGIAATLGTRPSFPIRKDFRSICNIEMAKFDGEAIGILLAIGRGWQSLQQDHPEIVKLALYAVRLTACLDQAHRRGGDHFSLKDLGILATIFQHDLYELNPMTGVADSNHDGPHFHIARLALQIYSDIVFFPAAEMYHAKGRLCRELLTTLRDFLDASGVVARNRFDHFTTSLTLWAVVMGGIVSSDSTYHRDWFARKMIGLAMQLGLEDWDAFKTSMEQFLWWDYLFNPRVDEFWSEAWNLVGKIGEDSDDRIREDDGGASATTTMTIPVGSLPNRSVIVGGMQQKWVPIVLSFEERERASKGWVGRADTYSTPSSLA